MGSELMYMRLFGEDPPDPEGYAEDTLPRAMAEATAQVREIIREYDRERERIGRDRNLSKVGREHKLAGLGRDALARLVKFQDDLQRHHRPAVEVLREGLRVKPREGGVAAVIERTELRRLLLELDEARRVEVLAEAVEGGDQATFDAFDSAPVWLNMVNPDVLDGYRRQWREARNPKLAEEVAQAEELLSKLEADLTMARQHIESTAGLKPDPVEEIAAGERSVA